MMWVQATAVFPRRTVYLNLDCVAELVRGSVKFSQDGVDHVCTIVYMIARTPNGSGLCEYVLEEPEELLGLANRTLRLADPIHDLTGPPQ